MERKIVNFENAELGANIRVIDRDGEPWFILGDLCGTLDMRTNDAMNGLDDDEKGYDNIASPGGNQKMAIVSEAGLYSIILRSRKPEAKIFKRWITHDVLPSIRKHGAYMTPKTIDDIRENPESVYIFARALCEERDRREIAEERLECVRPRIPFGTLSRINGLPRTRLIPSFWRSTRTTTVTTEVTEYQRSLFDTMIQLTV